MTPGQSSMVPGLGRKTRKALEPYERQWLQGRDHTAVGRYFALHFDEAERNRPGTAQDHSAGGVYLQEVAQIDGPPPVTSVALIDAYLAAYYKALTTRKHLRCGPWPPTKKSCSRT